MADTFSEYVDLISTASMDLYPSNHGSSFINKLVVPQHLPENTYVSLEEISYVSAFYNISKKRNSITIFDFLYEHPPNKGLNPNPYPIYGEYFNCPLQAGYYDSMDKLCEALNTSVKKSGVEQVKNRNIFSFDPTTLKFSYNLEGLWLTLFLRGDILNYLGVETTQASPRQYIGLGYPKLTPTYEYPTSTGKVIRHFAFPQALWISDESKLSDTFEFVAQLRVINNFIVYVDCIASQVTGDCFSDALRIIPIKAEKVGTNVTHSFQKTYALKVNKRFIPSIKVEIRDFYNELIDFKVGAVRLKLRFTQQT